MMFSKTLAKFHVTLPYIVALTAVLAILWKGGKAIDATWALGFLATLCIVDFVFARKISHLLPRMTLVWMFLFAITTVTSFAYSEVKNYGFDEVIHTLSLLTIFYWAFGRVQESSIIQWQYTVAKIAYVTTLLAVVIGTLVYVLQPVNRFVGTFFDYRFHTDYWPNAWAQALLLLLPMCVWHTWRAFDASKTKFRFLLLVGLAAQLSAIFLSYSRGATIALLGATVLFVLLSIVTRMRLSYKSSITRIAVVLLGSTLFFLGANELREQRFPVQSVQEKITFTAAEGKISINERAQFWQQSLQLIPTRPVFGYGPYAFRFVQPHLQAHVLATSDHPHNIVLKYALERGVPAALSFLLFLVAIAYSLVVFLLKAKKSKESHGFLLALVTGVAAVFAHNMIDFNMQFVGISLSWYLALAVIHGITVVPRISSRPHRVLPSALGLLLLLVLLLEGRALVYGSLGRHALADGNEQKALPYLNVAKHAWFTRDTHMSIMDAYIQQQKPSDALAIFTEYQRINIHDARAWKLRGDSCRQLRDMECALRSYDTAWNLSKYNDISPIRWYIETLADINAVDEITKNLTLYDSIVNDYQYAIRNGVHHIGLSHNVEELVGLLQRLQSIYPERKDQYVRLSKEILEKSQKDRDFVAGRLPGLLW